MADDADDVGIDQLLGGGGALLGIRGVVLREQLEAHLLAADLELLGIELLDRQAGAVLVVLAEVRDRAGQRRDMPDLDHGLGARRHGDGGDRRGKREAHQGLLHFRGLLDKADGLGQP